MPAKSKISSILSKDYAPGIFLIRLILYLVSTGLGIFDTYTDWVAVLQFGKQGFNNPLLPTDLNWLRAWYFFAILGTIFTVISISNESIDIFYSLWLFCQKYLCRCCRKTRVEMKVSNTDTHNDVFELKERNDAKKSLTESETEKEKIKKNEEADKAEAVVVTDACRCCYRCGWNFTSRAETLAKFSSWLQDVPMLMLAVSYAFTQTSCNQSEAKDVSGELFNVGLSALASTAAVAFRLTRSILRLSVSIGLRIKSKKDVGKMGKYCKFFSKILPENGDALYPPDTCAQCCVIPFYFTFMFDFFLVFVGCVLSLIIWVIYISQKSVPNFDDSLAIFRFQYTGGSIRVLNISNIITSTSNNGSFINFETVIDTDGSVAYCLSKFEYRKADFDIFFNSIEVEAISDQGEFCAIKTGSDMNNFSNYSRCTFYYTRGNFSLFYGYMNRQSGKITRFDGSCIVPSAPAGPELDLSIQIERNINHTGHPIVTQDLLILYVSTLSSTESVLFNVSVPDIVAGGLDKTYVRTFQDPSNGTNTTYLIRFRYDYFSKQFTYNVREIYNYPPGNGQRCSCGSILDPSVIDRFLGNGTRSLEYGYFDTQTGLYRTSLTCSNIPFDRLIPRHNRYLFISLYCYSLC